MEKLGQIFDTLRTFTRENQQILLDTWLTKAVTEELAQLKQNLRQNTQFLEPVWGDWTNPVGFLIAFSR